MTHIVDALQAEAAQAIDAMRAAAREARRRHALAELMRHLRSTAARFADRPPDDASRLVSGEWLKAWGLAGDTRNPLADDFEAVTSAFCHDAGAPTAATSVAIETAFARLERALQRRGTTLADQMATRSECAHGWWAMVVPLPRDDGLRPSDTPRWQPGQAFWEVGAAPQCGSG